jgi:hypothetical protein
MGIMTNKDQIPPGSQHNENVGCSMVVSPDSVACVAPLLLVMSLLLHASNQEIARPNQAKTIEEREVLVDEFEGGDALGDRKHDEEFVDNDDEAGAIIPYSQPLILLFIRLLFSLWLRLECWSLSILWSKRLRQIRRNVIGYWASH